MNDLELKAQQVLKSLQARELSLGSVESLTGGDLSGTICSIPGASHVYKGSIISYSNDIKTDVVGVKEFLIDVYGVVSKEVADAMAVEGRKKLGVDVCVSFTGNAGPSAEPGKAPVGRVYMSIATKHGVVSLEQDFKGERNEIREKCVDMMLDNMYSIFAS